MAMVDVVAIPKQIDLTSVFVNIQLPYFVNVLLLTSRCKSAHLQYTNVIIIWHLHELSLSRKQIKIKFILYLSFMSKLKAF